MQAIADRVRTLLTYEPSTGKFTWLAQPSIKSRRARVGCTAGHFDGRYESIGFDGRRYAVHRLAWFYVYGVWPKGQIDHINGNTRDNRIANLRDVPASINQQNQRRAQRSSRSGFLGVVTLRNGLFRAQIWHDGTCRNLGRFSTPQAAHAHYLTVKRQLHPGCTI